MKKSTYTLAFLADHDSEEGEMMVYSQGPSAQTGRPDRLQTQQFKIGKSSSYSNSATTSTMFGLSVHLTVYLFRRNYLQPCSSVLSHIEQIPFCSQYRTCTRL